MDLMLLLLLVRCPLTFDRKCAFSFSSVGSLLCFLVGGRGTRGEVLMILCSPPPQPSILETCALIMKIICLEIYYVVK